MSVNAGEFNQGEDQVNENEPDQGTIEPTVEPEVESTDTGRNPNWNSFYEALPDEMLRNKITPILETYDRNNNSRFEKVQQKYSPYAELIENNVPFDDIKLAFQLRQEVMDNPQFMFERLANHLKSQGVDISTILKLEEQGQGLENLGDEEDQINDPRLTALQTQQEQLMRFMAEKEDKEQQAIAARQQEQQETTWKNQTIDTLDSLETKYGKFDRNKLVSFAVMESNQTGSDVDFEKSLVSMREFAQDTVKGMGSFNAPRVFSGTGSMASGRVDTKGMTDEQVNAYVAARAKAMNGG